MPSGRISKFSVQEKQIKSNVWKVALYIRLSFEDGDGKIESYSISNQKELLMMYLREQLDMELFKIYVDDGYTGTNFNRPDFIKMLQDIKNGKVNTVIVKDLSRFGRNYIEVGNYLENIFPLLNIRFISLNDNIDSFKNPSSMNNLVVPFKNLMNDEYARDISNKVKSVLNAKKRNGEFVGGLVPYGYVRDPNERHHFVVDAEAANVIKMIFNFTLEGKRKSLDSKKIE